MTKIKLIPVLSILTAILMASPVFAHHSDKHITCTVTDCNMTGIHQHDGNNYAEHYLGDGHDNHQLCEIQSCTESSTHQHNGTTYFSHYNGDGHTYHDNVCHEEYHG